MWQACRPAGRLFCLVLAVALIVSGVQARGRGAGSARRADRAITASMAKPVAVAAMPHGVAPAPQGGPPLTSVVDTVYRADGTAAQGVLVITWPAFVEATGTAVSEGTLNVTLGANGALNVALAANAGDKPGAEKKDAAMSFLQNALSTIDAVATREIINPEQFKDGISKIIDGTVQCLNASTWCKQPPASHSQPTA
jgi:hypothetical protein